MINKSDNVEKEDDGELGQMMPNNISLHLSLRL